MISHSVRGESFDFAQDRLVGRSPQFTEGHEQNPWKTFTLRQDQGRTEKIKLFLGHNTGISLIRCEEIKRKSTSKLAFQGINTVKPEEYRGSGCGLEFFTNESG